MMERVNIENKMISLVFHKGNDIEHCRKKHKVFFFFIVNIYIYKFLLFIVARRNESVLSF